MIKDYSMLHFPGQRENEEVLTFINKHWIVYTKIIVVFFLVIIMPLVIFLLVWFSFYPMAQYHQLGVVVGLASCFYILFALLFMCIRWINEEFDIFILTTDRLIDVTQVTLLRRSVTATPLQQIQDTTGTIKGFIGTILHYGDLEVQTAAGDASDFFIDRVPDPEAVAQQILDWAHRKRNGEDMHSDPNHTHDSVPPHTHSQ